MATAAPRPIRYLEGLNGLRFIAALFVLISHAYESLVKTGAMHEVSGTVVFTRGRAAVDFFFTLSGFLITYLLVQEFERTGTVSLKRFYERRARRIWPLYYLVLTIGFVLLAVVYPRLFHQPYFEFNIGSGLLLYILFLPNLMAALYHVGMLNPLWSIGVEEQFYLFWAPFVKRFGGRMLTLIVAFISVTVVGYAVMDRALTGHPGWAAFTHSLRFQYMAIGSLFGWLLFHHRDRYEQSMFASRPFQVVIVLVLVDHYIFGLPGTGHMAVDVALAFLYGMLILNVSVIPNRLVNLEVQPLVHLGQISYGIYMYHMTVDYMLRMLLGRAHLSGSTALVSATYIAALLGITIIVAHVSYTQFETVFTRARSTGSAREPARQADAIVGFAAP